MLRGVSCLNPSHKGKGDSAKGKVVITKNNVLILVIKERVIPSLWTISKANLNVLILVIKERVIPNEET